MLKDGMSRCNFRNFSIAMQALGNTASAKFAGIASRWSQYADNSGGT
jgi:hypothetical protein